MGERIMIKSKVSIFDVAIDNITMQGTLQLIATSVKEKQKKNIYFVNAHCLNISYKNTEYKQHLDTASAIFGDGIGVKIAGKWLNTPVVDNVNGTDMFPLLCELCIKNDFSLYFLGAKPGIADKMKQIIEKRYKGLKIAGLQHGYFEHDEESENVIKAINKSKADILLVALGSPCQEKWIHTHKDRIDCYIQIGVGGLFDFYSGTFKRAPLWMRKWGMEWFYRMLQDPRTKLKRYMLGNLLFLFRIFKWKLLKK